MSDDEKVDPDEPRLPRHVRRLGTIDLEGEDGGLSGPKKKNPFASDSVVDARPADRTAEVGAPPPLPRAKEVDPAHEPTAAAVGATMTIGDKATLAPTTRPSDEDRRTHLEDQGVFARGGFGSIHRVHDRRFRRRVAMKVLETDDARAHLRFVQEGQVTAQLAHPNIVPVHEGGHTEHGSAFFTMQLVQGETLTKLVERADVRRASSLQDVLSIFLRICDAVSFAHARGVVHRDLKPDNVMVGRFGQVYVMDWGIALVTGRPGLDGAGDDETPVVVDGDRARLDVAGTVVGTPSFMAPEQAHGRIADIDETTDVFALGAILYFILTGTPPYRGASSKEKLMKAQACDIEPMEQRAPERRFPPALRQITKRALEQEKARRYPTVRALKDDLEAFLRGGWWFESRTFSPGDVVVKEGEEGDAAYIISGGTAEVYRQGAEGEVLVASMGAGEVFGETALLTRSPRIASVRATSPLTVMVVTRETVQDRLSNDSWMAQIVGTLARRFRDSEVHARSTTTERAPAAVQVRPAMAPAFASLRRVTVDDVAPVVDEEGSHAGFDDARFQGEKGSVLESSRLPALLEAARTGQGLDEAARLYEQSDGALGDMLVEWARSATVEAREHLTTLLERARDFQHAALAAVLAGHDDRAAPLFEKANDFRAAGICYRRAFEPLLAAHAFERAGLVDEALRCFDDAGFESERAALLVRCGRLADAARIFEQQGDLAGEIGVLRRVPLTDPFRVDASLRLASLMVSAGRTDEAAEWLTETLAAWSQGDAAMRTGHALAYVYSLMGRPDDAERIHEWLSEHGADATVREREDTAIRAHVLRADRDAPKARVSAAFETADDPEVYARLKEMPLFSTLTLTDMKDLIGIAEQRVFAKGARVVERGTPVGGVLVVARGRLRLTGQDAHKVIDTISEGDTIGEVGFLLGGVSAVSVDVDEDATLVFFERARLQRWLDHHEHPARGVYRAFAVAMANRVRTLLSST